MTNRALRCVIALIFVFSVVCLAQQPAPAASAEKDMITRIFSGEFSERPTPAPRWFENGQSYIAMEPTAGGGKGRDVVKYDTTSGKKLEVLITAAQMTPTGAKDPLQSAALSWSKDNQRVLIFTNTRRVWRTNSRGDYWFLDRTTGKLKKLGGDAPEASLMYAKFSPDATRVAYVKQNDIYVEDLATGNIKRLTQDGTDLVVNGGSDWVNEEELDIHDAFWWSPDGRRIAFLQFDMHGVGNFDLMYYLGQEREVVTEIPYPKTGPYPVTMNVPYPLAGTTNSAVRLGLVDVNGSLPKWVPVPGEPRDNYIARVQWADAKAVLIQQLNRLQNTDNYFLADADSSTIRQMWMDKDQAFITIGFGGLPVARPIHDGQEFLIVSEKDGWNHIYRITRDGRETLVTRGHMDTAGIDGVDEKAGWLYFIASPENATQRYLYRAPLDGRSDPVRVTPASFIGLNTYNISPDAKYAFHTFSTFDDPGMRELVSLPDHKVIRPSGDSSEVKKKILAAFLNPPTEFFKADAGDGVLVDGWMIKPPHFDASKKYPVLVQIYGEPAGQTTLDRWGGFGTLFHRYIAGLGYLVVSLDNSGTPAPRGRQWRKSVYGAVGVLSSKQQAAALRSLGKTHPFVDLDRVAVWGWSGGGTNTLNLMFRSPDLYKVGMAVAPVPDQRLYDTIYQERYMGLPQTNVDGYKQGSAINFAEGLKGDLLIVHGSGDDNVHYQGTELLVNRLIQLGKPFDFMTYPDRTHGIFEGPGTTSHLYHLLARYLTEHLPAGGR
jgi:dipeptidyl-peptidase-4